MVSRLTAMTIATSDVEPVALGPNEEGKWAGAICHGLSHPHHPGLVLCESQYIFDDKEAALTAITKSMNSIKEYVAAEIPKFKAED